MNIVKFKDINTGNPTFDKYFKGKYCFVIHMETILLMQPDDINEVIGITPEEYEELEKLTAADIATWLRNRRLAGLNFRYDDFKHCVNKASSPIYSNIDYYKEYNKNQTALDIRLIKDYRGVVARAILRGTQGDPAYLKFCPKKMNMLNYYALDMHDNTYDILSMIQPETTINALGISGTCGCGEIHLSSIPASGCGCGQIGSTNGLATISIAHSTCNLARGYRKEMKMLMAETFSDLNFWLEIRNKYINAIDTIERYTRALASSGLTIFDGSAKLDLNISCVDASRRENNYKTFVADLIEIADAFKLMLEQPGLQISSFEREATIRGALSKFVQYYEYLDWDVNPIKYGENWE